jgi:non-heme chloroperoxidase
MGFTKDFFEINFSELLYDYSDIPDLIEYKSLDDSKLNYRYYDSNSEKLIILLHGSGYHSKYLYKFAKNISDKNIAKVITPDLRGHGTQTIKRGDVDYIGQLDDDLDTFIQFCLETYKSKQIFIAGHSSGGGLALRLMGNQKRFQVDGYILLAPYLAHDSPTTNSKSNWAKPLLVKVILANILNSFGLHWLDHVVTVKFNLPEKYRDGSETLNYTHALITSFSPINYIKDLSETTKKTILIVGENDEAMNASEYAKILPKNNLFTLEVLPKINHMGVVIENNTIDIIEKWINNF